MEKIVFQVSGLKCGACVSSVKNKLEQARGVIGAVPDRDENEVAVEYDPAIIDVDSLKQIILDDGLALEA